MTFRVPKLKFTHPGSFLFYYIIIVGIYGYAYKLCGPNSFIAPYISRESAAVQTDNSSEYFVRKLLNEYIAANREIRQQVPVDATIREVHDLVVTSGQNPTYAIYMIVGADDYPMACELKAIISAPMTYYHASDPLAQLDGDTFLPLNVETLGRQSQNWCKAVPFELFTRAKNPFKGKQVIGIKNDDLLRWENIRVAYSGQASMIEHFGYRMLYFSALTITTTSFGDIVPLTPVSRALAASEAVLGWIIAGLFVLCAVRRVRPDRRLPKDLSADYEP